MTFFSLRPLISFRKGMKSYVVKVSFKVASPLRSSPWPRIYLYCPSKLIFKVPSLIEQQIEQGKRTLSEILVMIMVKEYIVPFLSVLSYI